MTASHMSDPFDGPPEDRAAWLGSYLDGELDPADAARVQAWLDNDPAVLREVERLRRLDDLLVTHYPDEPVPEGFAGQVLASVGISRSTEGAGRVIDMAWYRRPMVVAGLAGMAAALVLAIGAAFRTDPAPSPSTAPSSAVAVLETLPMEAFADAETFERIVDLHDDGVDADLLDAFDADLLTAFDAEIQGG